MSGVPACERLAKFVFEAYMVRSVLTREFTGPQDRQLMALEGCG
jgi:hypothetical protein